VHPGSGAGQANPGQLGPGQLGPGEAKQAC